MKRHEGEKQMSWGVGGGRCMKMKRSKRTDRVWGGVHKDRRGGVADTPASAPLGRERPTLPS